VVAIERPRAHVERSVRRQSQAGPNVGDDREGHVPQAWQVARRCTLLSSTATVSVGEGPRACSRMKTSSSALGV
jgi:hypothetical protein